MSLLGHFPEKSQGGDYLFQLIFSDAFSDLLEIWLPTLLSP